MSGATPGRGLQGRARAWWRRAADRAFAALAAASLAVSLAVVVALVATTLLRASRLVAMRATADAGLALSLRSLQVSAREEPRYFPYVSVAQVLPGSPAARLGIGRGDALVSAGGRPLRAVAEVWEAVGQAPGGREGLVRVAWVPRATELFGELVAVPVPGEAGRFRVRMSDLTPDSPAEQAGLEPGDVVVEAGGFPVEGTRQAWEAVVVAAQRGPGPVPLRIERGGTTMELFLDARREGNLAVRRDALRAIWGFVSNLNEPRYPELAGLVSAVVGSLYVLAVMAVVAFPLGVGAAVYLEEYAGRGRLSAAMEVLIANLAGVPSAIYGIIGLEVLARWLHMGRSILAGGITLALLTLPMMILAAREALRSVPPWVREAAYSLGATRWQAIRHHVLPAALPGILTGMILSLSRAIGEAAPLLLLGAFLFVTYVPSSLWDTFTVIPLQIFDWATKPQDGFAEIAAAAIVVLLTILLTLNATAVWIRSRYQVRW